MYKSWLFGQDRALEESEKLYVIYFGESFYKNLAIAYPRKLLTCSKKLVTLKFKVF